ncbi:MAG: hypothetical protein ACR2HD_05380 [Solirubrobacteraceae bacterium]|nr:MAG: hypothetical protein DLM63_12680 [Solirubrobacterales bacterium]
MASFRWVALASVTLLALLSVGVLGSQAHASTGIAPTPGAPTRIILASALDGFISGHSHDRYVANRLYNNPSTYVVLDATHRQLPPGWHAKTAMLFTSYSGPTGFQAAVQQHTLLPGISAVIYNNEAEKGWLTPKSETDRPDRYAARFAKLAHLSKLTDINASGDIHTLFKADAKYADVLVMQIQGSESDHNLFDQLLAQATAEARHQSASVELVAEITSNPRKLCPERRSLSCATADRATAARDIVSNRHHIAGFWVWVYTDVPALANAGMENADGILEQLSAQWPAA